MPQGKRLSGKSNTVLLNLSDHRLRFGNQAIQHPGESQALDDIATVGTWWRQLRNAIYFTGLDILGRTCRQYQDGFDDNDADVSNLLAKNNTLHEAYTDCLIDPNKAAFFRRRLLVQRRLREIQDVGMAREIEEIRGMPQGKRLSGKSNTVLLNLSDHRLRFGNQAIQHPGESQALDDIATVGTWWRQLRNAIYFTGLDILGRTCRQYQDGFDDNDADVSNLLAKNNTLHEAYTDCLIDPNKAAFFRRRLLVQRRLREIQDVGMAREIEEIRGYAGRNETRNFFASNKTISAPTIKRNRAVSQI
ncbi:hypothetical protein SprV_0200767900 [Sparganum proliferum]